MSESEFISELGNLGIDLNEEQLEQFKIYSDFLLEYNKNTNLTAIRNKDGIYLKHFFDSLLILKDVPLVSEEVLDIGSGAGFPGVPLKIIRPNLKLTLLDSNGKKTAFLKELRKKLKIDYQVVNERAEEYVKTHREVYEVVLSRAVSAMPILSELALPFVTVGGLFIPYKGLIDESLENGKYAIEILGGDIEKVIFEALPIEGAKRTFVIVRKKCKTPEIYPRLFDKISKKPLQK